MLVDLFKGNLVRLTAEDPVVSAAAFSQWNRNDEYYRLLDTDPPVLWSKKMIQSWQEKELDEESKEYFFHVRTLADDRLVGFVALWGPEWSHAGTWVGIGLGDRADWGKGYGSDAMHLALRYAFTELNMRRITLGVFEYNPRAIRSYEKNGFVHEGKLRGMIHRQGRRWDILLMGVLREEWLQTQPARSAA
jgi:RimJ/RimL family protein N-acetyltransferase